MLTFTINNQPLLLDESASIRITRSNPACFMDAMPGDISLGVSIPVNDHNRAILGNPERFEKYTSATSREFPGFEARVSGVLQSAGTLIVQTATKESYSGWVRSPLGNMGKEQREKKITDMPWPENHFRVVKPDYDDDDDHYKFSKIYNPGFWDGIGIEGPDTEYIIDENGNSVPHEIIRSVLQTAHLKNYLWYINTNLDATVQKGQVISPQLYLRYVIKEAMKMNGWFINRNDMLLENLGFPNFTKNACIYNNFNIVDMEVVVYPEYAYNWDPYTNTLNQYIIGYIENPEWATRAFNYADLLPKISMKDFLLGIQNSLNYIFFFRNDSRVDIIDRNGILKGEAIDINQYRVGEFELGEQKNVRLKFIPEYDKDDKLFGTGFEDLSDRWADYKENVATKAELDLIVDPAFGELRLVIDENNIYEYTWLVVEQEDMNRQEMQIDTIGWKLVSCGPQPFVYGDQDEEEEIKTEVSTLQQLKAFLFYENQVNQRGNLASMRSSFSDFKLRLIREGWFVDSNFYWEGDGGLFAYRWKTWADFWKKRLPIEAEFDLPLNVLSFCADNIWSKFRTEKGEFIIEEMETTFGLHSIGTTRIKGYKV